MSTLLERINRPRQSHVTFHFSLSVNSNAPEVKREIKLADNTISKKTPKNTKENSTGTKHK
jgi:hypothetical protein